MADAEGERHGDRRVFLRVTQQMTTRAASSLSWAAGMASSERRGSPATYELLPWIGEAVGGLACLDLPGAVVQRSWSCLVSVRLRVIARAAGLDITVSAGYRRLL